MSNPDGHDRGLANPPSVWSLSGLLRHAAIALAVALVYFVASRFALVHLAGASGVALLWPGAGITAGLLLATTPRWHAAIAVGTLIGTLSANLENGRPTELAWVFGLLNAGEAIATRLIFGAILGRVRRRRGSSAQISDVIALFIAALLATAMAAAGATLAILGSASQPIDPISVWQSWMLADFVGIICLAPLIKAVGYSIATRTTIPDWSRDLALLVVFAGAIALPLSSDLHSQSWLALAPGATVLPVLLWLSARSHPTVPASAVVILAVLIVTFARLGLGRYGDASIPFEARMLGAQATLIAVSFATAFISALYAERRAAATEVREGEQRLALIADTTPGSIFSLEREASGACRFTFIGGSSTELLGLDPKQLTRSAEPFLASIVEEDRQTLLAAFAPRDPLPGQVRLELRRSNEGGHIRWLEISAKPLLRDGGIVTWHGFIQDVTVRRSTIDEMSHRVRNLLNVVRYVAASTAVSEPASFHKQFNERLQVLALSHDLLAESGGRGASLEAVVRSQLAHLAADLDRRIHISGPELTVSPSAAQIIGMAIHELSTNACKYGALIKPDGAIHIAWTIEKSSEPARMRMSWDESGGPAFVPDTRRGFGHNVTVKLIAYELSADVVLEGRPDGLHWHLETDLARIVYGQTRGAP